MTNSTTSFFINCNNAGAEFVHAVVDGVPVAEVSEPVYVPDQIVYSFFPLNGVSKYEGISKPLLAVQITELVDGIFIGCTVNYCVADGTSFWHFFNSWSKMSRGFDCVSKPPVLQRWFLRDTDCPIHMPLSISKQLSNTFKPPPLQQRVLHFTRGSIFETQDESQCRTWLCGMADKQYGCYVDRRKHKELLKYVEGKSSDTINKQAL